MSSSIGTNAETFATVTTRVVLFFQVNGFQVRNLAAFALEHDAAQATHPLAVTSVSETVLYCQHLGVSLKQQPPTDVTVTATTN